MSTDDGSSAVAAPISNFANNDGDNDAQWDDEALAAATLRKGTAVAAPTNVTSKDWAEMKALDLKTTGNESTDIAEKLRVEETKAQLAAAREGMEREAQRLKEEKERKEQEAKEKSAARFGGAAAGLSSSAGGAATGGKWVPSRIREGGLSGSGRFGNVGIGGSQKLDTEDENLFPDLATADVIMKQKQEEQQKAAKKPTGPGAVGGGASWGSRPKLNLKPKTQSAKDEKEPEKQQQQSTETESKPVEEAPKEEETKAPEETTPPATEETTTSGAPAATTTTTAAAAARCRCSNQAHKEKEKGSRYFRQKVISIIVLILVFSIYYYYTIITIIRYERSRLPEFLHLYYLRLLLLVSTLAVEHIHMYELAFFLYWRKPCLVRRQLEA